MTALKKGRIFISYRRVDSAGYAGRIYDRLTNHFGEDAVFMDVDTIEAGLDFVVVLQNAVQSCDVLIALIGRQWLNIKGETGERRLDNPEDFVRIEIAAALDRDIRVIPVLVDGTNMPRSTELPDNLLPLARRNALQVNHHSFNADASRLISQLELALKAAEDSKIMKAQALKEEQGRKQRREEIERVLQSADLAINLKDWKLAREKLNEVLELDLSHTGAQGKLDIVQSKIAEKEKALEEEAERKRKEEEEKEQARLEQEKKEREEFEARARKDAEEKTRKEDAERRRKLEAKPEPAQGKTEKQKKAPIEAAADSPPPLEVHVSEQVGDKEAVRPKIDIRPFAIGGGILLILALCIWGGISLWNNLSASTPDPTRTSQPAVEEEPQLADTKTPSPTEATLGIGSTMTGSDGMTLLYVPAGEFTMGSEDGADDEKPVHTVDLDAFWIDQTEVTNAMFADFISETGHTTDAEKAGKSWVYQDGDWNQVDGADWTHPFGPSSGISDIMNHPVIHVSWNDAQAYCSWIDRRLPTEAEWEKAARGTDGNVYPWGDTFDGERLNFCDSNCSFSWADENIDDGYEFTAPVGSYPDGASPYGALDMAGNVWEWVADWYDAYPGNTVSDDDYGTTYRVLRGGSWDLVNVNVRSAVRLNYYPTFTVNLIGFRCSRSP